MARLKTSKRNRLGVVLASLVISHVCIADTTEDLQQLVHAFAVNSFGDAEVDVRVNQIDRRLKLRACAANNRVMQWHTPPKPGRNVIRAACESADGWQVYIPLQVKLFKTVHVANKALNRGDVITTTDTMLRRVDIATQHRGYIENIAIYKERKLKRPVAQGEVLHSGLFAVKYVVYKGQQIYVSSDNAQLNVKIKAIVLENGQTGDIIRVRNNSSNKVLQARVNQYGAATVL